MTDGSVFPAPLRQAIVDLQASKIRHISRPFQTLTYH